MQTLAAWAGPVGAAALVFNYRKELDTSTPARSFFTALQFDTATGVANWLSLLDAERAHNMGIWAAKHGLVPREFRPDPPSLHLTLWDRRFRNPLGMPACSRQGISGMCEYVPVCLSHCKPECADMQAAQTLLCARQALSSVCHDTRQLRPAKGCCAKTYRARTCCLQVLQQGLTRTQRLWRGS